MLLKTQKYYNAKQTLKSVVTFQIVTTLNVEECEMRCNVLSTLNSTDLLYSIL